MRRVKFGAEKVVEKPWGKEIWCDLNDRFCFKVIHINKGHKTSLQYHDFKTEMMLVVSGVARVTFDDPGGARNITSLEAGESICLPPGTVHRVEALSDLVIHEASSPEVWDVVRLDDDYER